MAQAMMQHKPIHLIMCTDKHPRREQITGGPGYLGYQVRVVKQGMEVKMDCDYEFALAHQQQGYVAHLNGVRLEISPDNFSWILRKMQEITGARDSLATLHFGRIPLV